MKRPKIKECPCCGQDTDPIQQRVLPVCGNQAAAITRDALIGFDLFWQCERCGCKWQHGQFEPEPDQDGEPSND